LTDHRMMTTHQNSLIQLLRSSQKTCRRWNRNLLMKMAMEIHMNMSSLKYRVTYQLRPVVLTFQWNWLALTYNLLLCRKLWTCHA